MALLTVATLVFSGCRGSRYVSADPDLESIYRGSSYYEVIDEFGRPTETTYDEQGGTKVTYNAVSLRRTSAAPLYSLYRMRNARTKEEGTPSGDITFSFNINMKCYSVESDFEHTRMENRDGNMESERPSKQFSVKPRVPRVLDFPYVEGRSPYAEVVSIEKVEVEHGKTKIYFTYCDRTPKHRPLFHDKGLCINPSVYIRDCATGEHIDFVSAEGISLYPEYTAFAHNKGGYDMLVYSLTFDKLPMSTKTIDIIEPGPEGFNFYGVDVSTPMNFLQSKEANPIPEY